MKKESLKLMVFYDNWCPVCLGIKEKIEKFDWFQLIEMVGIRENEIEKKINIPITDLEKRMHALVLRNNTFCSGFFAFISISWRIPLFLPFWPILKLLSVIGLGSKLYDFVANKRAIVPVGKCDASCKIK